MFSKTNPVIGKEFTLHDTTDPLGSKLTFGSSQFQEVVSCYKIYLEDLISQNAINTMILTSAHKAIGYYKQRSQILRGPSGAMHSRAV